jgi:copper chaperone
MQLFKVEGVSCGHCVQSISQALTALAPALQMTLDITTGELRVDDSLSVTQVNTALAALGYVSVYLRDEA